MVYPKNNNDVDDDNSKLMDNYPHIQCQDVGGPVTALALNKATSQVAVAGRSIFKLYSISEKNSFELISNLRVVKNVIGGCNDIAWNQIDDNILASATPSGTIVTWNLNKPGFSKMDSIYHDHKRIVNKICFHPIDPWLLISGSQDSIKVFDLRQNEAIINYSALSESVRDLQFSPMKNNNFIAVQDNGYVQLYDIRKKDRFEQCFPAHNGPILACDWHPDQSDLIATAGRDMSIKVWNLSSQTPQMQHCIPTMEAVSKIKWSYDNKNNIASCSLKRDYSINIWNIHRPFIACARFTEPHEITTGMAWRQGINSLISVTSNGFLYQLPISCAYKPLEHTNPVGMAINPDGDIALAIGNGLLRSIQQDQMIDNEFTNITSSMINVQPQQHHNPIIQLGPSTSLSSGATAAGTGIGGTTTTTTITNQSSSFTNILTNKSIGINQSGSSGTGAASNSGVGGGNNNNGSCNISNATASQSNNFSNTNTIGLAQQHHYQSSLPTKFSHQALQSTRNRYSVTRMSHNSTFKPRISSRSQLDVYKCTQMNWFVKTAQEYQLSNRPLAELCDHNAEVCAKLRRFQICQTWKILKLFYANINATSTQATSNTNIQPPTNHQQQQQQKHQTNTPLDKQTNLIATTSGGDDQISMKSNQGKFPYLSSKNPQPAGVSSSSRELLNLNQRTRLLPNFNESMVVDDATGSIAGSDISNESTGEEWLSHDTISYEAFQHKHDICGKVEKLIEQERLNNHPTNDDSASTSGSSNQDEEYNLQSNFQNNNQNVFTSKTFSTTTSSLPLTGFTDSENDFKISHLFNTKAYQFKFYEIIADVIADVLKYHVDNSDVQSAVSILIVLGDRIKNIVNERIPEVDRESWYYSYIDLLSKFQLWNVMAQVINLSPLSNINSINQTSTTIYTTCGSCLRPLNGKVSWICERCKTKPSQCSVCHGVVAGLMAWCQGCHHGGHLIHMSQWFAENDYCPTGCGHMCELSQWR